MIGRIIVGLCGRFDLCHLNKASVGATVRDLE